MCNTIDERHDAASEALESARVIWHSHRRQEACRKECPGFLAYRTQEEYLPDVVGEGPTYPDEAPPGVFPNPQDAAYQEAAFGRKIVGRRVKESPFTRRAKAGRLPGKDLTLPDKLRRKGLL